MLNCYEFQTIKYIQVIKHPIGTKSVLICKNYKYHVLNFFEKIMFACDLTDHLNHSSTCNDNIFFNHTIIERNSFQC